MNSLATYEFQSNRWWQQQAMHTPLTGSPEFARHRSAKSVAQPQRCLLRATNGCKTHQVMSIATIISLWCKCESLLANLEFTFSPLHCSTRGTCWSERSAMSILILSVESSLAWNCVKIWDILYFSYTRCRFKFTFLILQLVVHLVPLAAPVDKHKFRVFANITGWARSRSVIAFILIFHLGQSQR